MCLICVNQPGEERRMGVPQTQKRERWCSLAGKVLAHQSVICVVIVLRRAASRTLSLLGVGY